MGIFSSLNATKQTKMWEPISRRFSSRSFCLPDLNLGRMVLISFILIGFRHVCGIRTLKSRLGTSNVYVSLPYDMHLYITNMVYIQTNYGPLRFQLVTQPDLSGMRIPDKNIYHTSKVDDTWHSVEIPYHIPFYDPKPNMVAKHTLILVILFCKEEWGCHDEDKYEIQARYSINPYPLIILGETEKLSYQHGETLKARFRVLNAKQIIPSVSEVVLPTYRKYNETMFRRRYIRSDKIPNPFSPEFKCQYLRLHAADGLIWSEQKEVSAVGPINFDFLFESSTPHGVWMLELRCLHQKKTLSLKLQPKKKIPFYSYLIPPDTVYADSGQMRFKVCVRQHGGDYIHADVEIMVCLCHRNQQQRFPLNQIETDRFWEQRACAVSHPTEVRRCEVRQTALREPCAQFVISTAPFNLHDINLKHSKEILYVCHRVTTTGQSSPLVVSKCDFNQPLKERGARLIMDDRTSYHPDLPFTVTARLVHPGLKKLENQTVLLEINQLAVACDKIKYPMGQHRRLIQYFIQKTRRTSWSGEVLFVIPPVRKTPFLQMQVAIPTLDKNNLWHHQIAALDYPLLTEKTLKPWASYSGAQMQVWLGDTGTLEVNCHRGRVPIRLIANRPLHLKTIWAESMVSGEHKVIRFDPNPSDTNGQCKDHDDDFGHYTCISPDSDRIKCLPGWQGKDCLDPICAVDCHPAGGWCERPGQCQCKRTWRGVNCERCIPCLPNQCSFFAYYPCLCEYPTAQYTCFNLENVKKHRNTEIPMRTIFQRSVSLEINYQFLSARKFIFYFYEILADGTTERIAANADIYAAGCRTPALSADNVIMHHAEKRNSHYVDVFAIRLPEESIDPNESNQCHVRTGMLDEHPGQVAQITDIKRYMHFVERAWGNRWLYRAPLDTSEAFQSAGLLSAHVGLATRLNLNFACPHMSVMRKDGGDLSHLYMRQAQSQPQYFNRWDRLYDADFYEPQWIFKTVSETDRASGYVYFRFSSEARNNLSAVKLFAYCVTHGMGLWIGETPFIQPNWGLTVNFSGPLVVASEEVPYFRMDARLQEGFPCGQAEISMRGLPNQVTDMSPSNVTFCLCPGDAHQLDFAKYVRHGDLLTFIIKVKLWSAKSLCPEKDAKNPLAEDSKSGDIITSFQFNSTVRVLQRYDLGRVRLQALVCGTVDDNETVVLSTRSRTNSFTDATSAPVTVTSTCSLNWFWTSLDYLLKMDPDRIRTAEELALNLIILSGHVRFITMENVKMTEELSNMRDPLVNKISLILHALRRLQKRDYSITNFHSGDTEDSVWVSSLVLRAVKSVASIVSLDSTDKLYLIKDYLLSKQHATDGCFHNTRKNMPYAAHGENGRLSDRYDHVILTAYVLLALQPFILQSADERGTDTKYDSNEFEVRRRAIMCLKTVSINYDDMKLSNYAWALLTYAMSRDPMVSTEIKSINIRRLFLNLEVDFPSDETSLPMVYLEDNSEMRNPSRRYNALALEATAYLYLSLLEYQVPYLKMLHIIKYLVAQEDWAFASHPTQSSTTVFVALVHFAMDNSDKKWFEQEQINCTSRLLPSSEEMNRTLRNSERFMPVPFSSGKAHHEETKKVEWTVKGLLPNQCALMTTEFTHRARFMSAYNRRESPLKIMVYEISNKVCSSPVLEVCVKSKGEGIHKTWGTLVLEIWLPLSYSFPKRNSSFWNSYSQSEVNRRKPRQVLLGVSGEALVYFDGWNSAETYEKMGSRRRCISLPFEQTYYAELPQLLKLKAYDLHRLYPEARLVYKLPDCRPWLSLDNRAVYGDGVYKPVNRVPCPFCSHIDENLNILAHRLEDVTCNGQGDMVVFESVTENFAFGKPVIVYTTRLRSVSHYWRTVVKLEKRNCECKLFSGARHAFAFTDVKFDYSVNDNAFRFLVSSYTKTIHLVECGVSKQSVVTLMNLISQSERATKCAQVLFGLRLLLRNMNKGD